MYIAKELAKEEIDFILLKSAIPCWSFVFPDRYEYDIAFKKGVNRWEIGFIVRTYIKGVEVTAGVCVSR